MGFTLIELLVVMTIIGIMASVVVTSMQNVRVKARDTTRVTQLKGLESALNIYHTDTKSYPPTFSGTTPLIPNTEIWFECFGGHKLDYIPLIGPLYKITLPSDPKLDCTGVTYSWTYASNGTDFKLITHPENRNPAFQKFVDPATDGGPNNCIVDGPQLHIHYGIWSPGAACWRL